MVKPWEKILVYLLERNAIEDGMLDRYCLTQYGIAEALGMDRAHVSIAIKKLKGLELVNEKLEHVRGLKRKVKVYFLTQKGHAEAARTRERLGKEFGVKTIKEILELENREVQEMFEGIEEETKGLGEIKAIPGNAEGKKEPPEIQESIEKEEEPMEKVQGEEEKTLRNRTLASNIGFASVVGALAYILEENIGVWPGICCLLGIWIPVFFGILLLYLWLFPTPSNMPVALRICKVQTLITAVAVFSLSFFTLLRELDIVYYLFPLAIFHFLVYFESRWLVKEISLVSGVFMIWFPILASILRTAELSPSVLFPLNGAFFIGFGITGGLSKLRVVRLVLPAVGACIVLSTVALVPIIPSPVLVPLLGLYFIAGLLLISAFALSDKTLMEFYIGFRESVVFIILVFVLFCGITELVAGLVYAALLTFIFALVLLPLAPKKLNFPWKTVFIVGFTSTMLLLTIYSLLLLI
ncbi:MAG: hypothetical protein QW115_01165 [Thermoplasmata archaeon]